MNSAAGMRLLVTGSSGFVGSALTTAAAREGVVVFGFSRHMPIGTRSGASRTFIADLTDRAAVAAAIADARPTHVVHLAGVLPAASRGYYEQYAGNTIATAAFLEVIVATGMQPTIVIASSGAVYGAGPGARAIKEDDPPAPVSHYGVSKLAQENVALMFARTHRMPVTIARMFNLIGPGQPETLLASGVARQIAQAERAGRAAVITIGNLEPIRDFLDVRDAADALVKILELGDSGKVYNICRGMGHAARDCVQVLSTLARVPVEIREDTERRRGASEIAIHIGDCTRLREQTGWEPRIPMSQSLSDLLDYWREIINSESATRVPASPA